MSASDNFSPSAVAGVMVAPPDSRVELAASIGWAADAQAGRRRLGGRRLEGDRADVVIAIGTADDPRAADPPQRRTVGRLAMDR